MWKLHYETKHSCCVHKCAYKCSLHENLCSKYSKCTLTAIVFNFIIKRYKQNTFSVSNQIFMWLTNVCTDQRDDVKMKKKQYHSIKNAFYHLFWRLKNHNNYIFICMEIIYILSISLGGKNKWIKIKTYFFIRS